MRAGATRLVHLSDLHFGLERADLVQPLFEVVEAAGPDLVVVSGDLVQRARKAQFIAARRFLDRLTAPWVAVPGNHDIPLFNLAGRLLWPFAGYRRHICADLSPRRRLRDLRIFGINSAWPLSWRGGIARRADIDRLCRELTEGAKDVTNILLFHHPMQEPPGFERGETIGAEAALPRLAAAGLHVILSGHLHRFDPGLFVTRGRTRPILQVQGATALCGRESETAHGFAILDFDGPHLAVTPCPALDGPARFGPAPPFRYSRAEGEWRLL